MYSTLSTIYWICLVLLEHWRILGRVSIFWCWRNHWRVVESGCPLLDWSLWFCSRRDMEMAGKPSDSTIFQLGWWPTGWWWRRQLCHENMVHKCRRKVVWPTMQFRLWKRSWANSRTVSSWYCYPLMLPVFQHRNHEYLIFRGLVSAIKIRSAK